MDQKDIDGLFHVLEGSGIKPDTLVMSREASEIMRYDETTRKVFSLGEYRDIKVNVVPKMNRKQRRAFGKRN